MTTPLPVRLRSYDYFAGDEFFVEGETLGFTHCVVEYADGQPREGFAPLVADAAEYAGKCIHVAIAVDTLAPKWNEVGRFLTDEPLVVYPPMNEDGKVVPATVPHALFAETMRLARAARRNG